jgi:DNA-binding ferritin-like protein
MSEPIQPQPVEVTPAEPEKVKCSCDKMISKKNLTTHMKTAAHIKAVGEPVSSSESAAPVSSSSVAPASTPTPTPTKINVKQEFDDLHEKFDYLIDLVHEALGIDSEDDDEEATPTK